MGRIRRTYTVQFKQQIVQQIESGLISLTDAGKKYGVHYSLIARWRERLREGKLVSGSGRAEIALATENEQLKRKIGELVMELEELKKIDSIARLRKSVSTSVITARNLDRFREDANYSDYPVVPSTTRKRAKSRKRTKRT